MTGFMMRLAPLALILLLPGCLSGEPASYNLAFGSYRAVPVVVTEITVNGRDFQMVPVLVDARSDEVMPRANSGLYTMDYPPGDKGQISLDATWVELPTSRAYRAAVQVPLADLTTNEAGGVDIAPIFGPNGQLLITSDPVPTSEADQPIRDVAQVCGQRSPGDDFDYRTTPDDLPDLANVLAEPRPAPDSTACPVSGG